MRLLTWPTQPLHRAASRGKADIVEMLVRDPRVNINAVDNAGHSALHLACMEGDKEMAADLIDLGAGTISFYDAVRRRQTH